MKWLADIYLAEGPGIAKDAPKPKGLALVLATMWREGFELMKLNLLFVLVCLPVVTIPAAFAALMRVSLTMAEDRNVYLIEDFWTAFRRNAWSATAIGVGFAAVIALCALAARSYFELAVDNALYTAPFVLSISVMVLAFITLTYAFGLMVSGSKGLIRITRLSLQAAIARPGKPLAALAFVALTWLIHIAFYPVTLAMPALINFSFGALAIAFSVKETINGLPRELEVRAGETSTGNSGV